MATDHLQIPDIQANQNQKEVTANAAHNLLDRAMNAKVSVSVSLGDTDLTTTQARENTLIELTGTPGTAFNVDMPDANERTLAIYNNSDATATVRNSAGAGSGQPVISVGSVALFHYDGTDFIDLSNTTSVLFFKEPVVVATTAAGTLSTDFENGDTIDGVVLVTGDRILIKDQGTASENGIYVVQASGTPVRATDFDDDFDAVPGCVVAVNEGTDNAQTLWQFSNTSQPDIGTDALNFASAGGGGGGSSSYDFPCWKSATPTSDEVIGKISVGRASTLPADFSGAVGHVDTNPTAQFDIDVTQNGTSIGTVSIGTGGTFTFTTTGGTSKSLSADDVLRFVAPNSTDATVAGITFTLLATED